MFYLLLAILGSSMISILLRLSSGKIHANISMLAFNYLTCSVLGLIYAGFGSAEKKPVLDGRYMSLIISPVKQDKKSNK